SLMRDRLTVLSPVQNGSIWRVRIAWPIGTVHHFGKFTSKKDASDWIAAHAWLMECQTIPNHVPSIRCHQQGRGIGACGSWPRPRWYLKGVTFCGYCLTNQL